MRRMIPDPAALELRESAMLRWRQDDAIDVLARCCSTNDRPRRPYRNLRRVVNVCGGQSGLERLQPARCGLADHLFGPLLRDKDSDHARDSRLDHREEMNLQAWIGE